MHFPGCDRSRISGNAFLLLALLYGVQSIFFNLFLPVVSMTIRVLWAVLLTAVFCIPGLAFGQESDFTEGPSILHLDSLLQEIERANPSLRAARLDARALDTKRAQVSALPDPTAGISYQPYSMMTARGAQRTQWQIQQEIPFPGKRGLRGEIAGLSAEVASSEAEVYKHDLAVEVKEAFYKLYRTQEQIRLVQQFREELADFEEAATSQYEVGTGTQQSVLKAQVERGRLEVRLDQLEEERQSAQHTLARLLDRSDLEGLTGELRVSPPETKGAEDLVEVAFRHRPERDVLRQTKKRANRKEALARREFWPDFTIGVNYTDIQARELMPTMTGRDAFSFRVGLQIPLWRGRQRAQVEEAQLEERRAEVQLDALELEIRTRLDDLQSRLQRQQEQLTRLKERLIPQAETAREAALSAYSADRTDFLNLLDAERTLFQLQMDYEDTYSRYLKTRASLERTVGVISSSEISSP